MSEVDRTTLESDQKQGAQQDSAEQRPVPHAHDAADNSAGAPSNDANHAHRDPMEITKSSNLTAKAWQEEQEKQDHTPWTASIQGRAAIRLISRGIFGAGAYALASKYGAKVMGKYRLEGEPNNNPLHYIAGGVDRYISPVIEHAANFAGHDGKELVTFRPTKFFYDAKTPGRTLGHEVVALTFDFSAMSIGDSFARDIAHAIDPNIPHEWVDQKGHINYSAIGKNALKNTWKYLTYSAGEDWAVSIPYAYYIKGQRHLIEKFSPGFKYDSDRSLNGGSFKVDTQGNITGTYGMEGALDLQGRFTAYNMGTLMYRETYVAAGNVLEKWYKGGMKLPKGPDSLGSAVHSVIDGVGSLGRWALRDAVKATLYMTPTMPAFWMFRTPQHKYHATFINEDKGIIGFANSIDRLQAVHVNEMSRGTNHIKDPIDRFTDKTPTFFSKLDKHGHIISTHPVRNPAAHYGKKSEDHHMRIDPYENTYGLFDWAVNPLGKVNNKVRKWFHREPPAFANAAEEKAYFKKRPKHFTDTYVNASFAYTPYFLMKNDVMAYNWDNAKMDLAIERAIDGVTHFNRAEIKEGVDEIWRTMQTWKGHHGVPFKDPKRELLAQKAICDDESPSDGQNFYANSRCFDEALQDIQLHSDYHKDPSTDDFVERLKDSRQRSRNMMDALKREEAQSFADKVQPRSHIDKAWGGADSDASFTTKEVQRKASSIEDFPEIGSTLH